MLAALLACATTSVHAAPAPPTLASVSPSTAPAGGPAPAAPAVSTAAVVDAGQRRRALLLDDLLIEERQLDEAETLARSWAERDPQRAAWLIRLARIATARGRHAEAVQVYRDLLAFSGDDPEVLLQLGLAAWSAGETATAQSALFKARGLGPDPDVPYYLAELAFSLGRTAEGRRWAKEALADLPDGPDSRNLRMRLRMRSRQGGGAQPLGWEDALARDYRALYEAHPEDLETLFEWSDFLLRAGFPEEAGEPLRLARERFVKAEKRWRLAEAERLQKSRRVAERLAFLKEGSTALPGEPGIAVPLGEALLAARRWREARPLLEKTAGSEASSRWAQELLVELHRRHDHHLGPYARLRRSESSRFDEAGVAYHGYPRGERWRLEAEAGSMAFALPNRGYRASIAGGAARLLREGELWEAGLGLDLRSGAGYGAVAPGLLARWRTGRGSGLSLHYWLGKAWTESAEAVAVGATEDEALLTLETRPVPKLHLGGGVAHSRHRLRGGARGERLTLLPEAVVTLFDRPFYAGLGYRFVAETAGGEDAFFAALPLIRRSRTHYVTLPFGRSWGGGRRRLDGYLFNGHDPERGRLFGRGDLAGLGFNAEWDLAGRLRLSAGYEFTRDSEAGIATGRSHSARLRALWHWL